MSHRRLRAGRMVVVAVVVVAGTLGPSITASARAPEPHHGFVDLGVLAFTPRTTTVAIGTELGFRVVVVNTGIEAPHSQLTLPVPPSMSFVEGAPRSGGTCGATAGVMTCDFFSLDDFNPDCLILDTGSCEVIDFRLRADARAIPPVSLTVTATGVGESDQNGSDNSATSTVTIVDTTDADLSDRLAGEDTVVAGS